MSLTAKGSSFGRIACVSAALPVSFSTAASAADWLTYAHDPQRTGWAFEETTITPANVSQLGLKWKTKLENESYSLSAVTAPVVASNVSTSRGVRTVVYVAGIRGIVFAVDAETGEELWKHTFRYVVSPGKGGYQGTFLCPNGITATPVIDKETNTLYVLGGDGALYGLDLGSGEVRYGPVTFVAPFAKNLELEYFRWCCLYRPLVGVRQRTLGFLFARRDETPIIRSLAKCCFRTLIRQASGGRAAQFGRQRAHLWFDRGWSFQHGGRRLLEHCCSASLPDLNLADYYLPPNWRYLQKARSRHGLGEPRLFRLAEAQTGRDGNQGIDRPPSRRRGARRRRSPDSALHFATTWKRPGICCEGLGIWEGFRPLAMKMARPGCSFRWAAPPRRTVLNFR